MTAWRSARSEPSAIADECLQIAAAGNQHHQSGLPSVTTRLPVFLRFFTVLTGPDSADDDRFFGPAQQCLGRLRLVGGDGDHHAHATIEGAVHLPVGDVVCCCSQSKTADASSWRCRSPLWRLRAVREECFQQAAAGTRHGVHQVGLTSASNGSHDARGLQQSVGEGLVTEALLAACARYLNDLADQGVPVEWAPLRAGRSVRRPP